MTISEDAKEEKKKKNRRGYVGMKRQKQNKRQI